MRCPYCIEEIQDTAQVCSHCGRDLRGQKQEREQLEQIAQELREKIRSKIQTATVLAGFASVLLGLQITILLQPQVVPPRLLFLSIPLMSVAASLYIYAIMKLDALLMPKYFWEGDEQVNQEGAKLGDLLTLLETGQCSEYVYPGIDRRRHTTRDLNFLISDLRMYADQDLNRLNDDLVSLGGRMVWFWSTVTVPATYLVAISLVIMLLPLSSEALDLTQKPPYFLWWTFAGLLIAIGALVAYCWRIHAIAKKRWPLPSLFD